MLKVHRLNGSAFFINPERVISAEETPDTILRLENDEKLMIKESGEEFAQLFRDYQKEIRQPYTPN